MKLLGSLINDIEHDFVNTVSTERILQWRAVVQELVSVGFVVEFIPDHLRDIARAFLSSAYSFAPSIVLLPFLPCYSAILDVVLFDPSLLGLF